MNNLITQNFNGYEIHTFIWNEKPCWIASEIAEVLNYTNISQILSRCTKLDDFEEGIEYEILRKDKLKDFVDNINISTHTFVNNKTRNLIILYEYGLYGFLQYSKTPTNRAFKKWIRRSLLPQFKNNQYSQSSENNNLLSSNINISKLTLEEVQTNIQYFDLAYNNIEILNKIMIENNLSPQDKLAVISKIYSDLNIELPLLI